MKLCHCRDVDGPRDCHTEQSKSERELVSNANIYMYNLENYMYNLENEWGNNRNSDRLFLGLQNHCRW